ncbi:unnamed protein product [Rhizoctonia solani]|uniref:Low temperature requirement protein LtrA n=1 Tax=Rhizoctonia solani TaxID=456999 RepID=A0A8H2XE95_9AGAM|nr:unnamed protein product [Rhizoctonia solani]
MSTRLSAAWQPVGMNFKEWLLGEWFRGIRDDVNRDEDDNELVQQRLEQWRPFSQSPFIEPNLGLMPRNDHPQELAVHTDGGDEKAPEKPETSRTNSGLSQQNSISMPIQVNHTGPTWVHLFYDLAWTATFSTLTQNGKFDEAWDTVSYVTFFLVMWWMWASQTLYSVHFYTNDWVHLFSIFVQLIIFGLLCATTRGYDVTSYILKLRGANLLTISDIDDPEEYREDRVTSYSMITIAFSIAASRFIHWVQHTIVLIHGRRAAHTLQLHTPLKLFVLPAGLAISNGFFWAGAVLTKTIGKSVYGAKIKFVLWGVGLLVELVLHVFTESLSWGTTSSRHAKESTITQDALPQPELLKAPPQSPQSSPAQRNQAWPEPRSNVNLRERLEGITTVILGEGLNGIAGTLYSVISAPGIGGPVPANIICAAFLVYFLAYFYFEGPTGHRDPKGSSVRQMMWMLLHFPFHLGIILLLLGVKNQFIMTSYLSTANKNFRILNEVMASQELYLDDPASAQNLPLKNFLLKRGIKWATEFKELNETVTNNGTIPLEDIDVNSPEFDNQVGIWSMRMSLKIMEQFYKTFMGENSEIDPKLQAKIQDYYTNSTKPLQDWTEPPKLAASYTYTSIITDLLKPGLLSVHYIVGLAAAILLSLAAMNRLHSKPRDRFQWGIILSRFFMGIALALLILLNVGDIKSLWVYDDEVSRQAGVFRWIWAWMVLPTLAIAFAVEFIIERILIRYAGLAVARKRRHTNSSS